MLILTSHPPLPSLVFWSKFFPHLSLAGYGAGGSPRPRGCRLTHHRGTTLAGVSKPNTDGRRIRGKAPSRIERLFSSTDRTASPRAGCPPRLATGHGSASDASIPATTPAQRKPPSCGLSRDSPPPIAQAATLPVNIGRLGAKTTLFMPTPSHHAQKGIRGGRNGGAGEER